MRNGRGTGLLGREKTRASGQGQGGRVSYCIILILRSAPESLISIPFITRLSELLVPGGWLVGNFWTLNGDFEEHLNRWDKIFPTLYHARTRPTANKILFGRKNGKASLNGSLKDRAHFLQKKSGLDMLKMLVNLEKVE